MKYLSEGYHHFRTHIFPRKQPLYVELASGQSPRYLFITCSDSRVQPYEFTQSDAGDLFMERSLGNLVPRPGRGEHEALAAIEYAVIALDVEHIIICGHSRCGAMNGLLHPETLREMPMVAAWLSNAEETLEAVKGKYAHLQGDDLLEATIRENVILQVEHARRLPFVAPRVEQGRLKVHGWVYEFEHGEVIVHDPRTGSFVSLDDAYDVAGPPR